jgi:hypothetical protein
VDPQNNSNNIIGHIITDHLNTYGIMKSLKYCKNYQNVTDMQLEAELFEKWLQWTFSI